MVAEGVRLVDEVLAAGREVVEVAWSSRLTERREGEELLAKLRERARVVHDCPDRVLQQLSHLKTHQGVSVILRRPSYRPADLLGDATSNPLVVAAAGVRDPGNLGAIVRGAEAAGATGLLAIDAADPFREKAARGSAGSIFRLPCIARWTVADSVAFAREHGLQIVVAHNTTSTPCWEVDLRAPTLLVFGAEGAGVPEEMIEAADHRVGIPLEAPVESLNVSVAAGVVLFEARRQRTTS
jgi:RNA methyltransferase, TrmH family